MIHFTIDELDLIESLCGNQIEIYKDAAAPPDGDSGYPHVEGAETVEDAVSMLERIVAKIHGARV